MPSPVAKPKSSKSLKSKKSTKTQGQKFQAAKDHYRKSITPDPTPDEKLQYAVEDYVRAHGIDLLIHCDCTLSALITA